MASHMSYVCGPKESLWVAQKAFRWNFLLSFDAHCTQAVLFTLRIECFLYETHGSYMKILRQAVQYWKILIAKNFTKNVVSDRQKYILIGKNGDRIKYW